MDGLDTTFTSLAEKVNECDQEMTQSQTADQPTASLGRDTEHRQSQHNLSKATSSLFPSKNIAKLELTPGSTSETRTATWG